MKFQASVKTLDLSIAKDAINARPKPAKCAAMRARFDDEGGVRCDTSTQ